MIMCMYVCMYEYAFICVCVWLYIYVCVCVCMYVCINVCVFMKICVYICRHLCMYTCVCMYVCMYVGALLTFLYKRYLIKIEYPDEIFIRVIHLKIILEDKAISSSI